VKSLNRCVTVAVALVLHVASISAAQVTKSIRYELQGRAAYGILDGETVRELSGAP